MNRLRSDHDQFAISRRRGRLQPYRDLIAFLSFPPGRSLNLLVEGSIPSGLTISSLSIQAKVARGSEFER